MTDLAILVGGRGKRLGKLTKNTPKPLIQIKNKKFLDILLSKIIKYNFKRIFLICSYKKEKFFNIYHKKKIHNSKIICINEGLAKDTGGGLYKIKKFIKGNFFLINGDSFFDINLNLLSNFISDKKWIGCMAIANNKGYEKNDKMNNLLINKKNYIEYSKYKTNFMNGGVYFFKKNIFKFIKNKKISLEKDILNELILKKRIKGIYSPQYFIDMGTTQKLKSLKNNLDNLKEKVAFLDRDGVINKLKPYGYIENFKQFYFLPGVVKGIKFLNKQNYRVIVITNQACVGKGIINEKKLNNIHMKMTNNLKKINNSYIDDLFFSPYYRFSKIKKYRSNNVERKPNPGMFLKAINKWNVDIKKSFFIGDQLTDLEVSKKVGLRFYYKKNISFFEQLNQILKQ
jgi:histidinol-phosphate phosphatase family protein